MKVTMEIECSPIEARMFFGLPDMTPVNDLMMKQVTDRMQANADMLDPNAIMKTWMNFGGAAQENFFKMMSGALPGTK